MIVLMNVEGRRYIKDLTAANICKMTMPELIEFEDRVWTLAEKTKFPLRAIDVLNAIYKEVEWRMDKNWHSSKLSPWKRGRPSQATRAMKSLTKAGFAPPDPAAECSDSSPSGAGTRPRI